MELDPFEYRPVDSARREIRILEVQPHSNLSATVYCAVKHVSLLDDPPPEYEAVSYTWENPNEKSHVIANGQLLCLPSSAERCLRYLRHPDRVRALWIDSGSIHQVDMDERSQQVSIMTEIYRSCVRSLVWLGEEDDETAEVARQVDQIRLEMYSTDDFDTILRHHKTIWGVRPGRNIPELYNFFRRPWFSRLWVIQEVALAPESTAFCGRCHFDTIDLLRIAVWLNTRVSCQKPRPYHEGLRSATQMQRHCDHVYGDCDTSEATWWDARTLLHTASTMMCTEARDRVFAMLGLVRRGEEIAVPMLLRPDYQKPLHRVYHDATRYLFSEQYGISTLSRVRHRSPADVNGHFPTWAVRWDRAFDYELDPVDLCTDFRACNGLPDPSFVESADGAVLVLKGTRVGSVTSCNRAPNWHDICYRRRMIAHYQKAFRTAKEAMGGRCGDSMIWKRLACTLVGEQLDDGRSARAEIYTTAVQYWRFLRCGRGIMCQIPTHGHLDEDEDDSVRAASLYRSGLHGAWMNRRFFVTDDGSFGLGPRIMQSGDEIAVVAGGKCPVVLRRCGIQFKYIGEAYVYDVMDGEASGGALRTFDIV